MAHGHGVVKNTSFPLAALESWGQFRLLLTAEAGKMAESTHAEIPEGPENSSGLQGLGNFRNFLGGKRRVINTSL